MRELRLKYHVQKASDASFAAADGPGLPKYDNSEP